MIPVCWYWIFIYFYLYFTKMHELFNPHVLLICFLVLSFSWKCWCRCFIWCQHRREAFMCTMTFSGWIMLEYSDEYPVWRKVLWASRIIQLFGGNWTYLAGVFLFVWILHLHLSLRCRSGNCMERCLGCYLEQTPSVF